QDLLDLGRRDRVSGGDDHVVVTADVVDEAVSVGPDDVLKDIPALAHRLALGLRSIEVAGTRRTPYRQQAGLTDVDRGEGLGMTHRDLVPGDRQADRRWLRPVDAVADAKHDVQELGRAEELLEHQSRRLAPRLLDLRRERLAAAQR